MKKVFLYALLLCLGLAGCGAPAAAPTKGTQPVLPTLRADGDALPGLASEPAPDEYDRQPTFDPAPKIAAVRTVRTAGPGVEAPELVEYEDGSCQVRGPAWSLEVIHGLGPVGQDPVWADLDGDGETELLIWGYGPTSGLFTVGLYAYGLEAGRSVLKAGQIYETPAGEIRLEAEDGKAFFCLTPSARGNDGNASPLRLEVNLDCGALLLGGSPALPDGILYWGTQELYGRSFAALKRELPDAVLLDHWSCLVWEDSMPSYMSDSAAPGDLKIIKAVVTYNGVAVTGALRYYLPESGEAFVSREGIEPIPAVEDPSRFLGLSMEQLSERLGPWHFDLGSGLYIPCWFTEDGKLLIVQMMDEAENAALWDLNAGEPFDAASLEWIEAPSGPAADPTEPPFAPAAEEDTVTADMTRIPTVLTNAERWERFLETTARGKPDAVELRLIYESGALVRRLSFDGTLYRISDSDGSSAYLYLIADEETNPPPSVKFHRALFYLLSDDPAMTHERWMSHMLSSVCQPDFPRTDTLLSLYDP